MANVFKYRMGSGFPGTTSRDSRNDIEPQRMSAVLPFDSYGLPGKIVDEADGRRFAPIESGDSASDVYGFLVRPYPTQSSDLQPQIGKSAPATGPYVNYMGDILRRGFMSVRNNAGSPALNKPVFIRIANGSADRPIGGVEAEAVTDETIEIKAIFMDEGDADGNVEIAFNM